MTSRKELCVPGLPSKPNSQAVEGRGRELGEPSMVVHTCNPSLWEGESGRLGVQGHVQLQSRFFETSLEYVKPCLNEQPTSYANYRSA